MDSSDDFQVEYYLESLIHSDFPSFGTNQKNESGASGVCENAGIQVVHMRTFSIPKRDDLNATAAESHNSMNNILNLCFQHKQEKDLAMKAVIEFQEAVFQTQ